jgi:cystathionine beta-synthase
VVVLLPDTGRNYLSKLYNDDWMREHDLLRPTAGTARVGAQLGAAVPHE